MKLSTSIVFNNGGNIMASIKRLRDIIEGLSDVDKLNFINECISESNRLEAESKAKYITSDFLYFASKRPLLRKYVNIDETTERITPNEKTYDQKILYKAWLEEYVPPNIEILQFLESEKRSVLDQFESTSYKLKWIANPSLITKLIQELVWKGYVELPQDVSALKLSESLLLLFDLSYASKKVSSKTLQKNFRAMENFKKDNLPLDRDNNPFAHIKYTKKSK